jgi:PhnB protein
MSVTPIPEGHHTVTPYFMVKSADRFIQFLEEAFDGKQVSRHAGPDGKVMNAEVRVGTSIVMLGEPPQGHETSEFMMYLYVADSDAMYAKALKAGGKSIAPLEDQFYGDRAGAVEDPEGNKWWIASRKEIVPEKELAKRMEKKK